MKPGAQFTQLLRAWSEGDQGALEQLVPLVYSELHRLAQHYMAEERPGHTLQATALVNEAYLRLASAGPLKSDVVELRFFGGLSVQETAEALKISEETVRRDWKMTKSWLRTQLTSHGG